MRILIPIKLKRKYRISILINAYAILSSDQVSAIFFLSAEFDACLRRNSFTYHLISSAFLSFEAFVRSLSLCSSIENDDVG